MSDLVCAYLKQSQTFAVWSSPGLLKVMIAAEFDSYQIQMHIVQSSDHQSTA